MKTMDAKNGQELLNAIRTSKLLLGQAEHHAKMGLTASAAHYTVAYIGSLGEFDKALRK